MWFAVICYFADFGFCCGCVLLWVGCDLRRLRWPRAIGFRFLDWCGFQFCDDWCDADLVLGRLSTSACVFCGFDSAVSCGFCGLV